MKLCNNCGAQLSCGCQRRDASDGKSCCDQCITSYEIQLNPPTPSPTSEPKVEKKITNFKLEKVEEKSVNDKP
jgi:hypothetical protein